MAQAQPTFFVDDAAVTAMGTRVPDASTDTGMNFGASNNPGIGISDQNPDLQESLITIDGKSVGSWSLLDQFGNARDGQISQVIGGDGIVARSGNVATTWDTTQALYTPSGAASSGGITTAPSTGMGTAPDATIRYGANPDNQDINTDSRPDNDAPITGVANASLTDLATGWEEGA